MAADADGGLRLLCRTCLQALLAYRISTATIGVQGFPLTPVGHSEEKYGSERKGSTQGRRQALLLPAVRPASNYGTITNPRFVWPTDYHLRSGSHAVGASIEFGGLTVDFGHTPRMKPPAIGAYE